ncbi:hypothetical protein PIB30_068660 [Stylosanthes scabra]|uniref:Uncharacterized protein n=1 Tax=Stylosanthes scabra TaxID=79078 RepID=A0ABU6QMR1_9FABA|nr:hypothetical protein [Stylosanthes scabra]
MANLRTTQTEFYESILAQNASYRLLLREMEGLPRATKGVSKAITRAIPTDPSRAGSDLQRVHKLQEELLHSHGEDKQELRGSASRDRQHKSQPVIPYTKFGSKELLYLLRTPTDEPKPCSRTTH